MPKTRNVTRSQWESGTVSHVSATKTRKDKENEGEKENGPGLAGRSTRSQTATRGRTNVLGRLGAATAGNVLGQSKGTKLPLGSPAKLKTATKGKGKPGAAPVKRKKVPLQDITSQFLPAPESANRGEEHQNITEEDLEAAHHETSNAVTTMAPPPEPTPARLPAPKFTSPLPPSSPPSPFISSPTFTSRKLAADKLPAFSILPRLSLAHQGDNPWQEFDTVHLHVAKDSPTPAESNSDPFGFIALERKLKTERETALEQDAEAEDEYDEFAHVLVADTSSPRPVRRLKRSLYSVVDEAEQNDHQSDDRAVEELLVPTAAVAPVHFATPPTPHKDKQKRRRLSHEGHDVFDPCTSSVESSPSPTKASARKRGYAVTEDALDEFNVDADRSQDDMSQYGQIGKRSKLDSAALADASPVPSPRKLRGRATKGTEEGVEAGDLDAVQPNSVKLNDVKKTARKAAVKKTKADAKDDEDIDEKWEQERLARIEYFKRLEDYEVEEEDVYIV